MPDFEWRFKEENDPDDLPPVARPKRQRRNWGRFFAIALFIVACIGAVAFAVLAQRANVIIDGLTRDVLASHRLVQRAIAQSDAELFRSLLAADSADWRSDVQRLFDQRLLPAGDRLGLTPLDGDPQVDVTLSGNLKEAEVTTDRTYIAQLGDGVTQTVVLQQIDVYRFDGERWQWAQPSQDFWGTYQVETGDILSLDYPARDANIALRLAADLDAVLARFCAQLVDAECPPDLEAQLRLTSDPFSLISQVVQFSSSTSGAQQYFSMPAPSLLGAPIDEAGYQAVYRFYAARVVGVVFNGLLSDRPDTETYWLGPIVLNRYLIQLGLQPWPVEHAGDREPAPISLPDQDIVLLCVESLRYSSLYRYSSTSDTWTEEIPGRDFYAMYSMPTGDGVILHSQADGPTPARLTLWQNGRESILFDAPTSDNYIYSYGAADPSGRNLLIGISILQGAPTMALLDLNNCTAEGCAWRSLSGWPIWSPDGSQTILIHWQDGTLYRGDAQAHQMEEIGEGLFTPFWLDNETYGYVRLEHIAGTTRTWELVATKVTTDETRVLLGSERLLALLPEDERDEDFSVSLTVSPANPNLLLLTAYAIDRRAIASPLPMNYYGFLIDRESGDVSLQFQSQTNWDTVLFSPDGRWLVTLTFDSARSTWTLTMRDVVTGETETFSFLSDTAPPETYPSFDWSADGRWLFVLNDGILHLIAPGYGYHQTVVSPSPGCVLAAWINGR